MYSIGKFSKLTGVNVKTLTWYDNIGLLNPDIVNRENGYRYYSDESFKKLANIQFFKKLEFSINEIKDFSINTMSNKINEIQNKIDFLTFNIDLLKRIKDSNMDKKTIFELNEQLAVGKWQYEKSTTNFSEIISYDVAPSKIDKSMPKYLIFSERNLATDLIDTFGYTTDCFSLESNGVRKNYFYFIINTCYNLVLFQKLSEDKPNSKIKFHVYSRVNQYSYSSNDIYELLKKYEPYKQTNELNNSLIGKWQLIDYIEENKIDKYSNSNKTEIASHFLSPMYDFIEINKNGDVYILNKENVELENKNNVKIFTKENTKSTLVINNNHQFAINNKILNQQQKGIYKKFENTEYLFINLDNDVDLIEYVYVYKKIK